MPHDFLAFPFVLYCVLSTLLYLIYLLIFLTKSLSLFFAYLRAPYDMLIALEAFLKESNVVGSMSSEEITSFLLSYMALNQI